MFDQLYILPILLFSIVVHEIAHGWMALRLGDPTARDMGRLTLNPIPHIDPVGSVVMPLISILSPGHFFIGWAKPVPVNPMYFSNYKRDDILVTIVGPISNLCMAFVCTMITVLLMKLAPLVGDPETVGYQVLEFLLRMFYAGISLNVVLAIFNMIPIPPLDGSHVLTHYLPPHLQAQYQRIGFFGILLIMLLMSFGPFNAFFHAIISTVSYPYLYLLERLT